MKAITGNRLRDGAVVYLADDDQWSERFSDAARYDDDAAKGALASAQMRSAEIADAYVIDIDETGALTGRAVVRESIRTLGPSVRPDLGLQASVRA